MKSNDQVSGGDDDGVEATLLSRSAADSVSATDSDSIDTETALELLAVERRRQLLLVLQAHDSDCLSLDEVVHAVSRREQAADSTTQSGNRRVKNTLHHTHLPKLHRANVVTYDVEQSTVRLTADSDLLQYLLDAIRFTH